MLSNNKCILAYNIPEAELNLLKEEKFKVIVIKPEMVDMTIFQILGGFRFENVNENVSKEPVILFNGFSDKELRNTIKQIRTKFSLGILATVTQTSLKWKVSNLINHLVEEREWHNAQRKGK